MKLCSTPVYLDIMAISIVEMSNLPKWLLAVCAASDDSPLPCFKLTPSSSFHTYCYARYID